MSGTATPAGGGGPFGEERITVGADGKAVRLADLLRWLLEKEQTTRVDAVKRCLLPVLEGKAAPRLYHLREGDFAQAIDNDEWFATGTGSPGQQGWDSVAGRLSRRPAPSLGRGLTGAVAWLRGVWGSSQREGDGDILDNTTTRGAYLAVSEDDARACWGWVPAGEAAQAATPDGHALPSANAAEQWTGERLKKRRDELKANGVAKHMKQLSLESGLDDRKIRHLITAAEKAASEGALWRGLQKGDNVSPINGSRERAKSAAGSKSGPATRQRGASAR